MSLFLFQSLLQCYTRNVYTVRDKSSYNSDLYTPWNWIRDTLNPIVYYFIALNIACNSSLLPLNQDVTYCIDIQRLFLICT